MLVLVAPFTLFESSHRAIYDDSTAHARWQERARSDLWKTEIQPGMTSLLEVCDNAAVSPVQAAAYGMVTYLHAVDGAKIIAILPNPHLPEDWDKQDNILLIHMSQGSHLCVSQEKIGLPWSLLHSPPQIPAPWNAVYGVRCHVLCLYKGRVLQSPTPVMHHQGPPFSCGVAPGISTTKSDSACSFVEDVGPGLGYVPHSPIHLQRR